MLDLKRGDKGHLAFGWAAHFCFGAPLARMEGQIAFSTLLRRLKNLDLASEDFVWRENLGLRGLSGLPVRFDAGEARCCPVAVRIGASNRTMTDTSHYLRSPAATCSKNFGAANCKPPRARWSLLFPGRGAPRPAFTGSGTALVSRPVVRRCPYNNESFTIHKRGPLDPLILQRCFNEIIRRHEIWRSAFPMIEGKVVQRIDATVQVPLPLTDLSHLSPNERAEESARIATEDARRPFDLNVAPLFRRAPCSMG